MGLPSWTVGPTGSEMSDSAGPDTAQPRRAPRSRDFVQSLEEGLGVPSKAWFVSSESSTMSVRGADIVRIAHASTQRNDTYKVLGSRLIAYSTPMMRVFTAGMSGETLADYFAERDLMFELSPKLFATAEEVYAATHDLGVRFA